MKRIRLSAKSSVTYYPSFFSYQESSQLFQSLTKTIPWQKTRIHIFGKSILEPRLVSFHGDEGVKYTETE